MSKSLLDAIEERRTIRNYDPNKKINQDILEKIMHMAQISPTACDMQGTDFIIVSDQEKLNQLGKITLDNMVDQQKKEVLFIKRKNHGVNNVITCDAPYVVLIVKNERAMKEWVNFDAGCAAMSIMLAAQNYNIESMCLGVISKDDCRNKVEEYFNLKKDSLIIGVALGYKNEKASVKEKIIKCKVNYIE